VGGEVVLKNIIAMEDSKRLRFMHKEVNKIVIIVWAVMKRIVTSLEDKDDDFDKEIFYTPPQSPIIIIPIFSN
jgi:hypothetical protein